MHLVKILCFVIVSAVSINTYAQNFGVPKNETALRKNIMDASQKIRSIQCDFQQEKITTLLNEKAVSKGEFVFRKENKVRLEYKEPYNSTIIMNNGKLTLKDDDKTKQTNLSRNKAFQQLNKIIVDCVNGNMLSSMDFQSKLFENSTLVKMELNPTNKMIKNFLSGIVVILDKSDYSAVRIELNEASGDKTILRFSNKQLNGEVADDRFTLQ